MSSRRPEGVEHGLVAPVGLLHEIVHGDQRAVLSESGATLRVYEIGARPVIEPFDGPEAVPIGSQGAILAPWPNRVVDGRWKWEGAEHQLWITEPKRGHASHGLVRALRWTILGGAPDRITLETTLLAHPGWPFPLHFEVAYELGPDGLTSRLTARNIGRRTCPYGAATHPYLAISGGSVDEAAIRIPAGHVASDGRPARAHRTSADRGDALRVHRCRSRRRAAGGQRLHRPGAAARRAGARERHRSRRQDDGRVGRHLSPVVPAVHRGRAAWKVAPDDRRRRADDLPPPTPSTPART